MNLLDDENQIETAARVRASGKSPIDRLNTSLPQIVRDTYTAFRALVVNEFFTREGPIAIAMAAPNDWLPESMREQYKSDIESLTGAKIRDMLKVRPGDGKKPMTISFYLNVVTGPELGQALAKNGVASKTSLVDGLRAQEGFDSPLASQSLELLGDDPSNVKKYAFFKDVVEAKVFKTLVEDSIEYRLDLTIDAELYPKVIDSDKFSPYLVYLWVNNALSEAASRAPMIYDPRKSAALTNSFISKYGSADNPRPRINKNGFALYKDGRPLRIPRQLDATDKFMSAADAALNEDGEFDAEVLVKAGMANKIIYVDWLNDVLVYTTAHCHIRVLNLQGTVPLDAITETTLLNISIADGRGAGREFVPFFRAINDSVVNMGPEDVAKYMPKGVEPAEGSAGSIYAKLISLSGIAGKNSDILLSHMCGHNLDAFEDTQSEVPRLITTYRAYVSALAVGLNNNTVEVKVPSNLASLGIIFRLIGFEYLVWAISNLDDQKISLLWKEYVEEKRKAQTTHIPEFDIPNINTGPGGLVGLLPHQARVASSLINVPKLVMMPVSTGGGKTVLSFLRSLFSLDRDPTLRCLITTKGSLVKGTVTEINKMSGGKINAVPLRPVTLGRMKRVAGIKTFEDLMKWVRKLPPNTIFVNSYTDFASRRKIYDELPSIPGMLNVNFLDSQYQRIIRLLGIRVMDGDESHMIKNPDSNRSRGTCAAFACADYRGIMSGTMVSNTVLDLVGQTKAISPIIFGDNADTFAEQYGISTGLIKDDDTARIIRERMSSVAAVHQATRDQWSYMLPSKEDDVIYGNMTAKQEEFYNKLLQEAYLELVQAQEKKKGKVKPETTSEDDGDDEDEEDDEDEDSDEEDAEEAAFIAKARTSLQAVEQFLAAPDENEQYLQLASKPEGADLVSPKVPVSDAAIDAHIASNRNNMAMNKIIIFGINLSAIRHFARHSRHSSKILVYTAGDLEVLRQFKDDPTKQIMLAAETSVREGENWQMSSLILKMQPPWAPGDYEQALARMFRPDPRGHFNRDSVRHVNVLVRRPNGGPTLDSVKMARLISKFISNARVTWEGTPQWRAVSKNFDDLDMLRMNLELIMDAKNEDLQPYFSSWKTFVNWENSTNDQARRRKAQELEAATGQDLLDANGRIRDINKFISLAMARVKSTRNIPGTKRVFVPWVAGALPPDPENLGFSSLGKQAVSPGMVVLTEFGPGIIQKYSDRNLKVELYGGRVIGVRRMSACIVAPQNYAKFAAIVRDPVKWRAASYDAFDALPPASPKLSDSLDGKMPIAAKPGKKREEEEQEDERDLVDVQTSIVNGMPALVIMEPLPELKAIGWRKVDPYLSVRFSNWGAVTSLIEELDRKTAINNKAYDSLMDEIDQLKTGKAMRLTKRVDPNKVRSFFLEQHKKFGKNADGRYICKPYFLVIEDDIRLAFDIDSHDPKVISWIQRNAPKISGVRKVDKKPSFYMNVFNSVVEARKHLTDLVGVINFDQADLKRELTEMAEEIRALQQPRRRPL